MARDAAERGWSVYLCEAGGAAYLAGLDAGLYPEPEVFQQRWARQTSFIPVMAAAEREERYAGWRDAVARTVYQP